MYKGGTSGGLYTWPQSNSNSVAYVVAHASPLVWHKRLGLSHHRVLSHILKSCAVSSSSSTISSSLCSSCQLGKSSRFPLLCVLSSNSHVLDLIYTDIWGPAPVTSSNGYRYFVLFVDDYTHFTWFFPTHVKTDFYDIFCTFPCHGRSIFFM